VKNVLNRGNDEHPSESCEKYGHADTVIVNGDVHCTRPSLSILDADDGWVALLAT
jgi:hypothetical protein